MPVVEVTAPLKLRLAGTPDEDAWSRLEDALARHYARAIRAGGGRPGSGAPARVLPPPPRAPYDETAAQAEDYLVPGYQDAGHPVPVPLRGDAVGRAATAEVAALSFEQAVAAIDAAFPPGSGDPSVRRGVYARLGDGPLRLHFVERTSPQVTLGAVHLWAERGPGAERASIALAPGRYTLIVRPHGRGQLYSGGRLVNTLGNPENLDLAINFVVPAGEGEVVVTGYRYRWYPRMHLLRLDDDPQVATGAETTFLAAPEIWGVDQHQNLYPVHPLAWVYAFLRYRFEVWRLPARGAAGPGTLVRAEDTNRAFFTHAWTEAGEFEIRASTWLAYEDASPRPVTDVARLSVMPLELKMALTLASLEQRERRGGPAIFARSPLELRQHLVGQRDAELARPPESRSQARIDYLTEQIARLDSHLAETAAGPWPIRAIFTEPRTGETRALQLFVGPARHAPDEPVTWQVVDLTYPPFYATYAGTGASDEEALLAAFEDIRTRFRAIYPRGRILARIEFGGMEAYGIHAQDFSIETESWQRSAYEWLSLGASAVAAVGLAVALVFPPSAVVTGVLVVGAVAGATIAAVDIAERIHTGNFQWDTETWTDIATIAAAILTLGAARLASVARSVALSAEAGGLTAEAAASLAHLARIQRGLLMVGIGGDAARGILIAVETYDEIRNLDVSFPPELVAQYERIWPGHGRERWEAERQTRLVGILARAAVNGTLTIVSIRSQLAALHELTPRAGTGAPELPPGQRSPTASTVEPPPTPDEAAVLRGTQPREGELLTPHEVDVELEVAMRGRRRPSSIEGYAEEVELENGHVWRRRPDGRWCRFSNGAFCPTVSRTVGGPLRMAEGAGVREEIEEGRIVVVLHGTTEAQARAAAENPAEALTAQGGNFGGRLFTATDLAVIDEFAARTVERAGEGAAPGILGIAMSEATAARLRAIRVVGRDGRLVPAMRTVPIDDRPGLSQTIFEPAAIPILTSEGFFFVVTQ